MGEVRLRPDPDILGKAIAMGGEDNTHLHIVAHASVERGQDFNSNYYFARLLAAECRVLGEKKPFDARKSLTHFICSGAEKMVRFMEETNAKLVEEFEKERKK